MQEVKRIAIKINTEEKCIQVQKKLFKKGYAWPSCGDNIHIESNLFKYICFYENGKPDKYMRYSDSKIDIINYNIIEDFKFISTQLELFDENAN